MFGLSTWEIILICAVALIFIGPEQLPKVAKQVGKGLRQMRGAVDKVDNEVRRAVREAAAEAEAAADDDDAHDKTDKTSETGRTDTMDMNGPRPSAAGAASAPAAATPNQLPSIGGGGPPPRDWAQVGKEPIEGRVPSARPARPLGTPAITPANDTPTTPEPTPPGPPKKDESAA